MRTVLATRETRRIVAVSVALARSSHLMGRLTRNRAGQPTTPVRLALSDPARTLREYRCFGAETVGVRGSKSRNPKGHRQLPTQPQSSRARSALRQESAPVLASRKFLKPSDRGKMPNRVGSRIKHKVSQNSGRLSDDLQSRDTTARQDLQERSDAGSHSARSVFEKQGSTASWAGKFAMERSGKTPNDQRCVWEFDEGQGPISSSRVIPKGPSKGLLNFKSRSSRPFFPFSFSFSFSLARAWQNGEESHHACF